VGFGTVKDGIVERGMDEAVIERLKEVHANNFVQLFRCLYRVLSRQESALQSTSGQAQRDA